MTDQPSSDTPRPTGAPGWGGSPSPGGSDPLDDTQRVDVPRYAPTPDPRPDTRWAWAATERPPTGDRWYEPTGAPAPASDGFGGPPPYGGAAGYTVPVTPARRRSGSVVGPVVGAALLSAVLASGGTALVLDRTGAFQRTVVTSSTGAGSPAAQQSVRIDESSAVIDSAAKVSPAVVKITVEGQSGNPFGGGTTAAIGSGVVYDANGWIVTNRHVVSDSTQLIVELRDGRQFPGRVYGIDTLTDLAIVKVDETGLPTAPIGKSDGLKVGQLVVAIGSPLGTYSFSVTSGIVSGKGRDIQVDSGTRITNLIQTDAAINPGNSGGPLVDATGAIVGINTAVASDSSGIGFAIPIDIARPIMAQAVAGRALSRPWIGIRYESIDLQLKKDKKLPVDAGALVTTSASDPAVVENSPAANAGVKDGDIILSIDGTKVDTEHPLDALLVQFSPGDVVTLDVLRDGKSVQVKVTLGTRPGNL